MICGKCKTDVEKLHGGYCRQCKNEYQRNWYRRQQNTHEDRIYRRRLRMFSSAKRRANKIGIPFDISVSDIQIPDLCPVLGIKLSVTNNSIADNSPTLDKIDPSKGYVIGNIVVISAKANRIKSNADYIDIEKVAEWLKSITKK